ATTQNHQLSLSGGRDRITYYLSANYYENEGVILGSDFKRYATRFSLDNQLKPWAKIGVSANISRTEQQISLADAAESTIGWGAVSSPLMPVKNLDGYWGGRLIIGGVQYSNAYRVGNSMFRGNERTAFTAFGKLYADIQILKDLSFRNDVSYNVGINNNL